ncbi:tRNA synthetases class II family protein [Acinetobacter baumannii 25253_7]|nr:tRNA synthetases class II family protein [Acinetobacter baumannii 25253_7]
MSLSYQPTCSIDALKARAKLYTQIRQFFAEREVMEVETPIVSQAGVTDVHLASVQALRISMANCRLSIYRLRLNLP